MITSSPLVSTLNLAANRHSNKYYLAKCADANMKQKKLFPPSLAHHSSTTVCEVGYDCDS